MEKSGVETIICFNKTDLSPDNMEACRSYSKSGYETIFISAREGEGIDRLREIIKDRTTVFAGSASRLLSMRSSQRRRPRQAL